MNLSLDVAMAARISVLVVDDVPLIRDAVKIVLTQSDYAQIIGEAGNGEEAVRLAANEKPDIILMDIEMPNMNGIEAAKVIRQTNEHIKIIMLTASNNEKAILSSFAAGADGYILKDKFPATIQAAITTVRLGSVWLDPGIARRILEFVVERATVKKHLEILLTEQEVATLNEVASCSSERCLVNPNFVANLRRLEQN